MEWLAQTKRLSKEEDYMGLEIVDAVIDNLWLVDRPFIKKHKKTFNDLCDRYHKPNPVRMFNKDTIDSEFQLDFGVTRKEWLENTCRKLVSGKACRLMKYLKQTVMHQLDSQLQRYKKASDVLLWQWFEVIDFMYERPELINPNLMDEYIESTITRVCLVHRKNNPFKNGIRKRFGTFWKDKKGHWRKERRQRF